MDYTFIIPIYNRPDELRELLDSFTRQKGFHGSYEIIVVEDGSSMPSKEVVESFQLPISYHAQANTGPSGARNYGASFAQGEWLVFLDSDTILPDTYLQNVEQGLQKIPCDLWGGPDAASPDFTITQKAINYSMTSLLTTGGIRGRKKSVDKFYPRTFNMGIRASLFHKLEGFRVSMRYGEDLDLSMRALESGAASALLPEAWLYHKRRGTFKDFFNQVRHSGRARIVLNKYHHGTLGLVHVLPSLFTIALLFFWHPIVGPLLLAYFLAIVCDVYAKDGSLELAGYAVVATLTQHIGYGVGFIEGLFNI